MKPKKLLKLVEKTVKELLPKMSVDAPVSFALDEDADRPTVNIEFEGEDLGYLIGSRGSHMRAMQYVFSLIVNNKLRGDDPESEGVHIYVDVAGYNQDRKDKIERIALGAADDAKLLGSSVDMEPMNPADRRIVHMILSTFDDVTTESEGEGRDRHVRVIPVLD